MVTEEEEDDDDKVAAMGREEKISYCLWWSVESPNSKQEYVKHESIEERDMKNVQPQGVQPQGVSLIEHDRICIW